MLSYDFLALLSVTVIMKQTSGVLGQITYTSIASKLEYTAPVLMFLSVPVTSKFSYASVVSESCNYSL